MRALCEPKILSRSNRHHLARIIFLPTLITIWCSMAYRLRLPILQEAKSPTQFSAPSSLVKATLKLRTPFKRDMQKRSRDKSADSSKEL